jgi:hypothetical protein
MTSLLAARFPLWPLFSVAIDLVHTFAGSLHWCREEAMGGTCPNIMECVPGSMVLRIPFLCFDTGISVLSGRCKRWSRNL